MQNKPTKQPELESELQPLQAKNKYALVETPITPKQILQIFQRTPKEHIHQRPAKGGGTWDFVTGVYVKKVLNYVFGWLWDFEIIDKGEVKSGTKIVQVWVQGRLTIRDPKTHEPIIVKTQFGGADVKFKRNSNEMLDYANDLKAAATDALKKCASEIGIANDVYGKNEFREIGTEPKSKQPDTKTQTKQSATASAKPHTKEQPAGVDYSKKLADELRKRGAHSLTEAVALYNNITGESVKYLRKDQAKKYYFNLLNSPMGKK